MKTMFPTYSYYNDFVTTYALGHLMKAYDCIYITYILVLQDLSTLCVMDNL